MKRRISIVAFSIMCLLSILLTGCLDDSFEDPGTIIESTEAEESKPDPAAVGTYIGEDGSVFLLFDDGTANYYCTRYKEPNGGMNWTYSQDDKKIKINYYDGIKLTADAEDLTAKEYFIKGESPKEWIDEAYTKVSDEAPLMNGQECYDLLYEQLPLYYPDKVEKAFPVYEKKSEITYSLVEYGSLVFYMPSDHKKDADSYGNNANNSIFLFLIGDGTLEQNEFDMLIKNEAAKTMENPACYYRGDRTVLKDLTPLING